MNAPAKARAIAADARASATPGVVILFLLGFVDCLEFQATQHGWITGRPDGDTSYAVIAVAVTVAILVFAVTPMVSARPTVGAWIGMFIAVAAVQTQAAIAAVRLPATWPVPPAMATIGAVLVAVWTLTLLTRRRPS